MINSNRIVGLVAVALAFMMTVLGAEAQAAPAAAVQVADKGAAVYAAQKCSVCHGLDGKGNQKRALDSVGIKLTAEEIRLWIVDPVDMAKKTEPPRKTVMKAAKLPADDLAALVAFLVAKKKT